ncbi:MAG: hypothetical protein JWO67_4013 [Streptosporangiaceae bacterium]|nr:hypothetical protein [Streptosporangiaceae bacterium]
MTATAMATVLREFSFTAVKEAVSEARHQVVAIARSYGCMTQTVLDDLDTLSGEVLANAVIHTHTEKVGVQVAVDELGGLLRVVVCDDGSGGPIVVPDADPLSEHGRGVLLLQMLAADWGVVFDGYGSTVGNAVWFELKL